jgi:excisionase family DNA binding protein
MSTPEYLTVNEVAALARAPIATIYQWNHRGIGPRPRRVGRRLLYRRDEVLAWIEAQQVARPA